jgi:hypothetical protein
VHDAPVVLFFSGYEIGTSRRDAGHAIPIIEQMFIAGPGSC